MFVLLINEINPNIFCFVTCFLFIFTHETLPHRGLLHTIFCIAYVRICRRYLPWLFAVRICRGFFVYISESFFVYVSKSCLYGGKPFLYVCKTFWFVRFSLLTVLLLVIVVAVMGHRPYQGSAIREPKIPSSLILSFHFSLILIKQYRALKPLRNPYWYFVRF